MGIFGLAGSATETGRLLFRAGLTGMAELL